MSWLPLAAGSSLGSLAVGLNVMPLLIATGVLAPLAVGAAALLGRKIVRDERERQITYRRQQAKAAARKYVDEVAFGIGKETRDALRFTQRRLRDEFTARAAAIHRSSERALAAARSARDLPPAQRSAHSAELREEAARLERVRGKVAGLAAGGHG